MPLMKTDWEELIYLINHQQCTPFIGAGATALWFPMSTNIARTWALEFGYPLDDSDNLSRVAEFIAINTGDRMFTKKMLSKEIKKIKPPDFSKEEYGSTPHAVLSDLNLPIYITTNQDKFMEAALISRGRKPISEFCKWNSLEVAAGYL